MQKFAVIVAIDFFPSLCLLWLPRSFTYTVIKYSDGCLYAMHNGKDKDKARGVGIGNERGQGERRDEREEKESNN